MPTSMQSKTPRTTRTSAKGPASNAAYALFVLFVINLLNFFDRQLPGALAEPIRREFHLSDTTLGLLGTVATLMYAIVGLPLGRLPGQGWGPRPLAHRQARLARAPARPR